MSIQRQAVDPGYVRSTGGRYYNSAPPMRIRGLAVRSAQMVWARSSSAPASTGRSALPAYHVPLSVWCIGRGLGQRLGDLVGRDAVRSQRRLDPGHRGLPTFRPFHWRIRTRSRRWTLRLICAVLRTRPSPVQAVRALVSAAPGVVHARASGLPSCASQCPGVVRVGPFGRGGQANTCLKFGGEIRRAHRVRLDDVDTQEGYDAVTLPAWASVKICQLWTLGSLRCSSVPRSIKGNGRIGKINQRRAPGRCGSGGAALRCWLQVGEFVGLRARDERPPFAAGEPEDGPVRILQGAPGWSAARVPAVRRGRAGPARSGGGAGATGAQAVRTRPGAHTGLEASSVRSRDLYQRLGFRRMPTRIILPAGPDPSLSRSGEAGSELETLS
jgi:hypothetical protein